MPPIYDGQFGALMHQTSGQVILLGVLICVIGVAVNGAAGVSKDKEFTFEEKAEAGETGLSTSARAVAIAILAGFMSSFFAFGLDAGKPIGDLAKAQPHRRWPRLARRAPEPARPRRRPLGRLHHQLHLVVDTHPQERLGGPVLLEPPASTPCAPPRSPETPWPTSTRKTREYSERLSGTTLLLNYLFAAMAGVIWYFQFFFYSMGTTKMGKYDFSSWTLHMASIIIFATLWGIFLKEWKGTSGRTKWLVAAGLSLLIASTVVVGYGNYLASGVK